MLLLLKAYKHYVTQSCSNLHVLFFLVSIDIKTSLEIEYQLFNNLYDVSLPIHHNNVVLEHKKRRFYTYLHPEF